MTSQLSPAPDPPLICLGLVPHYQNSTPLSARFFPVPPLARHKLAIRQHTLRPYLPTLPSKPTECPSLANAPLLFLGTGLCSKAPHHLPFHVPSQLGFLLALLPPVLLCGPPISRPSPRSDPQQEEPPSSPPAYYRRHFHSACPMRVSRSLPAPRRASG